MRRESAEELGQLLGLVDHLDDEDVVIELRNALDENRWGWLGATVTPRVILGSIRTSE